MSKIHRIFIMMILPIFFFNLIKTEKKQVTILTDNHQYILSEKTCNSFFSCNPSEVEDCLMSSYWVKGNFQSAVEDENGNLVLTLSDSDVEYWKKYIDNTIKTRSELDALDGCQFIVGDQYHSLEVHSKKEYLIADGFNITYISVLCGIMQMLNDENPNEWYVDIKLIDVESGKTVKTGRFPTYFDVSKEDWDKALGVSESAAENT